MGRTTFIMRLYLQRHLLLMTIPFVIVAFVFSYLPLWGWVLAFMDYKVGHPIWSSAFIGLDNLRMKEVLQTVSS